MRLAQNPVYRSLSGVLDNLAIKYTVVQKGKHQAMVFDHNDKTHSVSFALTPSDWRAPYKARSYLRRLLNMDPASPMAGTLQGRGK